MFNPLDLTSKNILISGASSGIGRATAQVLSKLGATLLLTGRKEATLRETQATLNDADKHHVLALDLNDIDGISAAVQTACSSLNLPLSGIVHCAGVSTVSTLRTQSKKQIDNTLLPNTYAAIKFLSVASSKAVMVEGGSVVLLSSVSSFSGAAGFATYAASKGALNALARSAAKELAPRKVRVNCIAPGYVDTPMLDELKAGAPEAFDLTVQRHFLGLPTPEEVGMLVAYLLSDASRRVTGTTITIDGGFTC